VATLYGGILGAFMLWRFSRGKWQAVSLEREKASDTVTDPAVALPAT
jgi:hypothetical protein